MATRIGNNSAKFRLGVNNVRIMSLGSDIMYSKNCIHGVTTPNTSTNVVINGTVYAVTSDYSGVFYVLYNGENRASVAGLIRDNTNITDIDLTLDKTIGNSNYAFSGCTNLLKIIGYNVTDNVGYRAFYNCNNLTTIDGNVIIADGTDNLFYKCASLANITGNWTIKKGVSFSACPLTLSSAMVILRSLQPVSTSQTITFSSYTATLINASEEALSLVAEAVSNGWTIAGI